MSTIISYEELLQENTEIQARLADAEETLWAIRSGTVDALIVSTTEGDQVFTLQSADQLYRLLVEEMQQGAVTISDDGIILYCNQYFATILGCPSDHLASHQMDQHILSDERELFAALLRTTLAEGSAHHKFNFQNQINQVVPVFITTNLLQLSHAQVICLIVTDLRERKREEMLLRQSEAALKQAQCVAHVGSWTWNIQSNRLEWSDEMYRIFGIEKENFTGDLSAVINNAIHPDDRLAVEKANVSVMEDKRPSPLEYRVVWSDGTIRVVWAEAGEMILDATGNPVILTGIVQDITERKLAEQALWLENERFRLVSESNLVGIVIADWAGNTILANDYYLNLLGVTRQEYLAGEVDWRKFTPPEWLPASAKAMQELREHGICEPFEKEYLRRDGTRVTVYVADALLPGPEELVAGVIIDITERKQAETALHRYTERLAMINRLNHTISSSLDIGQVYDDFVRELRGLIALDLTSIVRLDETGEHWQLARQWTRHTPSILPGEWRPVKGSVIEWLVTNRVPFSEPEIGEHATWPESEFLQREGLRSRLFIPLIIHEQVVGTLTVASHQPFAFSEEEQAILMTIADHLAVAIQNSALYEQIQQHAAELEQNVAERTVQLETANKELEAFSYSVSHDLRAPLRAIDGFSRILLENYAPDIASEAQRYLHLIRDNAQHMGSLIDDLLTFSRLSRQPLNKQSVDLVYLVQKVLADLRATEPERIVEITIGDLPTCEGDSSLLRQVFANLLGNALKYTQKREVTCIAVDYQQIDGEDVYSIKDNGVGFDMQYANKLFGVFQRLHRAEDYEGTGVGLAIVQRIIHRHGGRIWADAEVDKGAMFYFTLGEKNPNEQ